MQMEMTSNSARADLTLAGVLYPRAHAASDATRAPVSALDCQIGELVQPVIKAHPEPSDALFRRVIDTTENALKFFKRRYVPVNAKPALAGSDYCLAFNMSMSQNDCLFLFSMALGQTLFHTHMNPLFAPLAYMHAISTYVRCMPVAFLRDDLETALESLRDAASGDMVEQERHDDTSESYVTPVIMPPPMEH